MLQKYSKYAIGDLVPGMKWSDVKLVCGKLTHYKNVDYLYAYKNLVLYSDEETPGDKAEHLTGYAVRSGEYLGIKIGKCKKEDIKAILDFEQYDYSDGLCFDPTVTVSENDTKYSCSSFKKTEDGYMARLQVYCTDNIVTEITVSFT